jgi:hypothetical protein
MEDADDGKKHTTKLLCSSTADSRSSHDFSAAAYWFALSCALIF